MKVRELVSRKAGVQVFAVDREDKAADEATALVEYDGDTIHCHRCHTQERIFSRCQHLEAM